MESFQYRVLIVDSDEKEFEKLKELLGNSFSCERVDTPSKALVNIQKKYYQAVISELNFENNSGVNLLKNIRLTFPNYTFFGFTQHQNLQANQIIDLVQNQINGFILKPLLNEDSIRSFQRFLETKSSPLQRLRQINYRMENNFHIVIPSDESDIINAMEITDQLIHLLYPNNLGNFADLKIALYEALSNAKLHGGSSSDSLINLQIEFKFDRITCHIQDQGKGFQHKNISGHLQATLSYSGLKLISALMDDVSFNAIGNEINFLKLIRPPNPMIEYASKTKIEKEKLT